MFALLFLLFLLIIYVGIYIYIIFFCLFCNLAFGLGVFEYFQYLIHCVDLFSPFCNNLLLVEVLNQ